MGPSAVVRPARSSLLVMSLPTYDWADDQYRAAGLDPAQAKFVGVKNMMNFRFGYAGRDEGLLRARPAGADAAGHATPSVRADHPSRLPTRPRARSARIAIATSSRTTVKIRDIQVVNLRFDYPAGARVQVRGRTGDESRHLARPGRDRQRRDGGRGRLQPSRPRQDDHRAAPRAASHRPRPDRAGAALGPALRPDALVRPQGRRGLRDRRSRHRVLGPARQAGGCAGLAAARRLERTAAPPMRAGSSGRTTSTSSRPRRPGTSRTASAG